MTHNRSPQCRALMDEKLSPIFPVGCVCVWGQSLQMTGALIYGLQRLVAAVINP